MKVKRQKHVRKVLMFYKNNFGYQSPYTVLVDGTFCKAALKFQVNIREQLPKYMDSGVRLCTTKCAKAECEALGPLLYGPLKVLRQFEVTPCTHKGTFPASRCIKRMALRQEQAKYFVATQDQELSNDVRNMTGVPLLYISHNAISLEKPADISKDKADELEMSKLTPSEVQMAHLKKMKKVLLGIDETGKRKKRKKKGGPNPLSCKKKKRTVSSGQNVKKTEGVQHKKKHPHKKESVPSVSV